MTHVERYQHFLFLSGQQRAKDIQYKTAFYVLSSNDELFLCGCNAIDSDGIDFEFLTQKATALDESNQLLIEIARNLFSNSSDCKENPFWNLSQMESPQFLCALNAIGIAGEKFELTVENGQFVISDAPLRRKLIFYETAARYDY